MSISSGSARESDQPRRKVTEYSATTTPADMKLHGAHSGVRTSFWDLGNPVMLLVRSSDSRADSGSLAGTLITARSTNRHSAPKMLSEIPTARKHARHMFGSLYTSLQSTVLIGATMRG